MAQKPIPLCTLVLGLALFTYIEYLVLLLSCSQRTAPTQTATSTSTSAAQNLCARQDFPLLQTSCALTQSHLHTHTHAQSSVDVVGLVLRNLRARYPRSHSRVRLLVTHTYHKTAGLIRSSAVCMSFGPFDQLIAHMSAGRQAVRPAETGPRVIPRCLPFLTVCPVCSSVCMCVSECECGHSF